MHRRKITDPEKLKEYADGVDGTLAAFGGEVLARCDDFDVLEGKWTPGEKHVDSRPERITVIRFPEMDALKRWCNSDRYAEFRDIRQNSSSSDIVAVEGNGSAA